MKNERIDNHESYSNKGTPDGPSSIELEGWPIFRLFSQKPI